MAKFPLTEMAVKMFCPGNVVQPDDAGLPSILVWIPKFKNSDVLTGGDDSTHPAFIVNGKEIDGFYYSKYENVVYNGKAYSLPAEDPAVNISIDTARECCESKGYGWHLSTAAEWAAIALWCKKNGFLPYGNSSYGKYATETEVKAIPSYKDKTVTNRVATGTGPLTWSHDGTPSGIWDLCGNINEWQGGIRLVWGELQILANNDAADPDNPQNETSTCWKAIKAADGSLVDPECMITDAAVRTTGYTVKLNFVNDVWTYSTGISSAKDVSRDCLFEKVACTNAISEAAKLRLRSLALLPDEGTAEGDYEGDKMYVINGMPLRVVSRSSLWNGGESAGVFAFNGNYDNVREGTGYGFRSVYIPNIGE